MANNYFQFKQFILQQDMCAMKVCTDACLFGSWISEMISKQQKVEKNILDIGSGTGLISLMIAQKNNATIDAVEIDTDANFQSIQNINKTPWKTRINSIHQDIILHTTEWRYDWIVSNPPFYSNDLKSDNTKKNVAMHDTSLQLTELFKAVNKHLKQDGFFAVLLPYHRLQDCINEAATSALHINEQLLVKQTPKHPFFRCMLLLSRHDTAFASVEISIKDELNEYTEPFKQLLKDYYLYL